MRSPMQMTCVLAKGPRFPFNLRSKCEVNSSKLPSTLETLSMINTSASLTVRRRLGFEKSSAMLYVPETANVE